MVEGETNLSQRKNYSSPYIACPAR